MEAGEAEEEPQLGVDVPLGEQAAGEEADTAVPTALGLE
jgi:hypothetical protein